jgi:hypothetical protein
MLQRPTFTNSSIRAPDIGRVRTLVPEPIDRDPWVLYHCTTNLSAEKIETMGLVADRSTTHSETLRQVLTIYRNIGWCGRNGAGYPVLRGFSHRRNNGIGAPPFYLSAFSRRSLVYALQEFAGGETAAGLRAAHEDLVQFCEDENLRLEHLVRATRECIGIVQQGGLPIRVIAPDCDWIRAKLEGVREALEALAALPASVTHGLLYAVQITEDDIPHLSYSPAAGFEMYRPIAATRIRHRVQITEPAAIPLYCDPEIALAEIWRDKHPAGPIARIAAHGAKRDVGRTDRHRQVLESFDAAAGHDLGCEIGMKHGTEDVRRALLADPTQRTPTW